MTKSTTPSNFPNARQRLDLEATWNDVSVDLTTGKGSTLTVVPSSKSATFTVEFWVYVANPTAPDAICTVSFTGNKGKVLGTSGLTNRTFTVGSSTASQSGLGFSGWNHIALVYSVVNGELGGTAYVNEAQFAQGFAELQSASTVKLSLVISAPGWVTDVRVWGIARSISDIFGDRAVRLDGAPVPADLLLYAPLTDGKGSSPKVVAGSGKVTLSATHGTGWRSDALSTLADIFGDWLQATQSPIDDLAQQIFASGKTVNAAAGKLSKQGVLCTTNASAIGGAYGITLQGSALSAALSSVPYDGALVTQAVNVMANIDEQVLVGDLIIRAAVDPDFCAQFVANPTGVMAAEGLTVPSGVTFTVLLDTATVANISVEIAPIQAPYALTTLPQNPTSIQVALWIITTVQAGGPMANGLLSDPASVLSSMGVELPAGLVLNVYQNTLTQVYIVVPYVPANSDVSASSLMQHRFTERAASSKGDPSNVNVNVTVNANAAIDVTAAVNAVAAVNVEAVLQVSSALVAAEVVAVVVIPV